MWVYRERHGPFRLQKANDGQWCWTLVARNGQVLATSELYNSKQSAYRGIKAAVKVVMWINILS